MHVTYDMRIGGTEQVIKNLIGGNQNDSINMSILCLESPVGPFGQQLQQQGIEIVQLQRQDGFDIHLIKAIRQVIKQHQIDVLHCHQYTPWVYGLFAALGTSTKVIFTEHGRFYPDFSSWKRRLINPWLAKLTHRISAISAATRTALIEYEFIPGKRIDVIYNGILGLTPSGKAAAEIKASLDIPANAKVLGTVARFDPIKNHLMMLDAFAKVRDQFPDTYLVIVGDGEERPNIEARIAALNLHENVRLTGYNPKPQALLEIMDIYLLSSLSEGTSMTLLEAMSLAKPCVVTRAGGNPEIVDDGVTGLVTPNDDGPAFADAICQLLATPQQAEQIGQAGMQRFQRRFAVNAMISQYHNYYHALVKQK